MEEECQEEKNVFKVSIVSLLFLIALRLLTWRR